jgi:hypothetical protein
LHIISPAWRTIILEGKNVQLERQRRSNSNANKVLARIVTRKELPLPPYTPEGYKLFQKTVQINSLQEQNPDRQKYRIPASLLGKNRFQDKPRMCAKSQRFSRMMRNGPSGNRRISPKRAIFCPKRGVFRPQMSHF